MNYHQYFQDQIATEKRRQVHARQRDRDRIEQALTHLEPLLNGMERAFAGHIYHYTKNGLDFQAHLRWAQFIDLDDLRASFRLLADHHPVIEISIGPTTIILTNCWQHLETKLHDFTAQDVEHWAQTITNWTVPNIRDRTSSPF